MPWGPDVETNLAISSANHLKVRFIQQSRNQCNNKIKNIIMLKPVIINIKKLSDLCLEFTI
ncbi:hypothetical protein E3U36_00495 [Arsenophonus endosymbiont of Aphis craccivora]|uniref:hypothetical protein n=1 Tax=Arsenophonus endosymbiont of Aphis craccivora TaxID=1231049 RepID=UPI0015DBFDAA|nr:hypothetical protein [Arsenophonus endosymbiont of Aphis craccivora]QLK87067.1 hypothetical protein E3U36_00495 [Arsenophonus endosymbiont of Aphis craccivora]